MDVFEAIEKRASVRALQAVDVPEADLERILEAGRRAPSGRNVQPLEYLVVRDPEVLGQLATAQRPFADVSVAIVVTADPEASVYWVEDAGAAIENMLLAVTALGYATVWIAGTLRREEDAHKRALGVPDNLRLMVALPIGQAAGEVRQAEKLPLAEKVHYERYGNRRA